MSQYHTVGTVSADTVSAISQLIPITMMPTSASVIVKFYECLLRWLVEEWRRVNVVGFNILRFDVPFLIQKGVEYGVCGLVELNRLWSLTFAIDYLQAALPLNKMRFKARLLG